MNLFESPENFDPIWGRKELNRLLREARAKAKPASCILCGKPQTSF